MGKRAEIASVTCHRSADREKYARISIARRFDVELTGSIHSSPRFDSYRDQRHPSESCALCAVYVTRNGERERKAIALALTHAASCALVYESLNLKIDHRRVVGRVR